MKRLILISAALILLSPPARTQKPPTTTQIYCGKNLKRLALFAGPDFRAAALEPLPCGATVEVRARQGDWAKVRTQEGVEGFAPSYFVGPLPPLPKVGKCNRPSPLDSLEQFDTLSDTLGGFFKAENFSETDLRGLSSDDIEKLAADCYFAAYSTAEKPGWIKAQIFRIMIGDQVFGRDFSRLSPSERVQLQVYAQKLSNVLSKAFDLGYKDGAKIPCNPK
jgi:hypothetical protein